MKTPISKLWPKTQNLPKEPRHFIVGFPRKEKKFELKNQTKVLHIYIEIKKYYINRPSLILRITNIKNIQHKLPVLIYKF